MERGVDLFFYRDADEIKRQQDAKLAKQAKQARQAMAGVQPYDQQDLEEPIEQPDEYEQAYDDQTGVKRIYI